MTLQTYTQDIDTMLESERAIQLLHKYYTSLTEKEKPLFVSALIGQAVTTHKLHQHERQK